MAHYRNDASATHLFDTRQFEAIKQRLKGRENSIKQALADAINMAAERSKELSIDEWNGYFKIDDAYVRDKIHLLRKASLSSPEAIVVARSRATRANNFRYRINDGRKGVKLNVRRGSSGGTLKNAFVIPRAKSNGKPLIVERLTPYKKGERRDFKHGGKTTGRYNKAEKLRFKAIYGPSVNQHFHDSKERVAPQAMSEAKQQFLKAIKS